jgi:hypothetical protein
VRQLPPSLRERAVDGPLFAPAAHVAGGTFAEHPELMTDWDARRTNKRLEPLQDYVPEVLRQSR